MNALTPLGFILPDELGDEDQWGDHTNQNWELADTLLRVTVSDVAPAFAAGRLWFDSIGGQLYVAYDDGSSQQFVTVSNAYAGMHDAPLDGATYGRSNGAWSPISAVTGGGSVSITQTVVALTAGADATLISSNPARKTLAVLNIDTGDATLAFDAAATAGNGWSLPAAGSAGGMGGGYDWGSNPPRNSVHAISAAGTRIVVWEGV